MADILSDAADCNLRTDYRRSDPDQRRIVAQVDQLMSLCDKLEAGLLRSQADNERLMEAVVSRVVAAPD